MKKNKVFMKNLLLLLLNVILREIKNIKFNTHKVWQQIAVLRKKLNFLISKEKK